MKPETTQDILKAFNANMDALKDHFIDVEARLCVHGLLLARLYERAFADQPQALSSEFSLLAEDLRRSVRPANPAQIEYTLELQARCAAQVLHFQSLLTQHTGQATTA